MFPELESNSQKHGLNKRIIFLGAFETVDYLLDIYKIMRDMDRIDSQRLFMEP